MNTFDKNHNYYLQKIRYTIEVYGWHVAKVAADKTSPSFGYSIGFFQKLEHPEVIIIGPEVDIIHYLINQIGEAIVAGTVFQPGYLYPTFIEGAHLRFVNVNKKYYSQYVAYAQAYYRNADFPVLQCLYPDSTGCYPDQAEWPEAFTAIQPFLGNTNGPKLEIINRYADQNSKLPNISFALE